MKKLSLLLPLFSIAICANAQTLQVDSIKKYFTFDKDKFTSKVRVIPNDKIEGKTNSGSAYTLIVLASIDPRYINISYSCNEIGCVGLRSQVSYVFKNGKNATFYNNLGSDCENLFQTYFKSLAFTEPSALNQLTESPATDIRVTSDSSVIEIHLSDQQGSLLLKQVKWIKYYNDNKRKVDKILNPQS